MATPTNERRKQKWWDKERTWFWVGASGLIIGALVILGMVFNNRSISKSDWFGTPSEYAKELTSAFVGAIVTIAITAFLLKAQQESTAELQQAQARAEKERENNAKFFEEKIKSYDTLLNGIENFLKNKKLDDPDEEFNKLILTCIHVSYMADKLVLAKLKNFTDDLYNAIKDDESSNLKNSPITYPERKIILRSFAEVAASIKTDLHRSRITLEEDINRPIISKKKYDEESPMKEKRWLDLIQGIIDNLSSCNIAYNEAEKRLKRSNR